MRKHFLLLATVLTLPVAAVVSWVVTADPARISVEDPVPAVPARAPEAEAPSSAYQPVMAAEPPLAAASKIVRRMDEAFPAVQPEAASTAAAVPPPAISPRFTVPVDSKAAAVVQGLRNTPAAPDERIRVLPVTILQPDPAAPGGPIAAGTTVPAGGSVVLEVDSSLHDPAAWIGEETPGGAHEDLKTKIADEFAAEISRAAKKPEAAGKTLNQTWRDAQARANADYQLFFGFDAANRAALNAGRAAVSGR